ncbi:hypothetical protein IB236_09720 [Acidovorax sp. ACV02]|uniref:hypothetical protein n=1 Tax=Acidovorax sp. ACV02 TaxID=2769310 RepID=UPI001786F344|nr:hypothetical protein [Acidovorax sp. ACV02]MBD9405612.1 hypothetical protein [Acidovorax sp. ACV02]
MTALPPIQVTQPETFILESLNVDDESNQRMDGRVLYEVLRLQGKNPIYYYFRTQVELIKFAEIFRASGYRYLHLSCHGDEQVLQFTFGQTTYADFGAIFEKKLNNRRLFISGCSLGNEAFAKAVFEKSGGMYSVTAPTRKVFFSQTSSFWPAFYYMMHAWDTEAMKRERLSQVLERLTEVFEMPMAHFFRNTGKKGAVDCRQFGGVAVAEALVPAKEALPGEPSAVV